jgi:hypothetical protein
MNSASEFANIVEQLLASVKGATRLASDEQVTEGIFEAAKASAHEAMAFLAGVKSSALRNVAEQERPAHVDRLNGAVQEQIGTMASRVEGLVVKEVGQTDVSADLGDEVERPMLEAARAIEAATARLTALLNTPSHPEVSSADLNVNQALLGSAMAITSAIAQLIRAATLSQQEIVAKGRGSASASQFYKKNHRWTEGLVSAARMVAVATTNLVETADGIVKGTHSIEQMVVAAQEVAASTAQLVAASRVKGNAPASNQQKKGQAFTSPLGRSEE